MRQIISHYPPANVILATDDDREGEAIAWHICQVFGLPVETTHRIVFHSITYEAILDAVRRPRTIDMQLVHAQQTRQILDVIVGFKISPFLWRHVGNPSKTQSLSAGRCQTPALRLVYDAHLDAYQSSPQVHGKYKLRAYFFAPNLEFATDTTFSTAEQTQQFLLSSIPENTHHLLPIAKPKEYHQAPPSPFHTSHLLQVASSRLGLTPKNTMALCQQLYQEGHITYMRTDSKTYSPEFQAQVQEFIGKQFGTQYTVPVTFIESTTPSPSAVPAAKTSKTSKTSKPGQVVAAQEAHEAIRPTHIETMGYLSGSGKKGRKRGEDDDDDNDNEEETQEVSGKKQALYQLIWRNTIESCMPACRGMRTRVQIQGPLFPPIIHDPIDDVKPAKTAKKPAKKSKKVTEEEPEPLKEKEKQEQEKEKGAVEKCILYTHDIEVPHFPGWKRASQWSDSEYRQIREKQESLVTYVTHLKSESSVVPNRIDAEYT
jgi:DNA topoisomerase-1